MSTTIISVEGGIGCGKSTALGLISTEGARIIPEPLDDWRPLLQRFYQNDARWAFTLQTQVLASYAGLNMTSHDLIITERSPYSGLAVFASLLLQSGALTEVEMQLLLLLARLLPTWAPHAMVYIYTPAHLCASRINVRGRTEEDGVPLSYLLQLEQQHTAALSYAALTIPVFVVDGTQPPAVMAQLISAVASHVTTARQQNTLLPGYHRICSL